MIDTPRTDALIACDGIEPRDSESARDWQTERYIAMLHMARQLERELTAATAEIERLKADLAAALEQEAIYGRYAEGCLKLRKEAEAARDAAVKDAERYRYAKDIFAGDNAPATNAKVLTIAAGLIAGKDVDSAIDAAMSRKPSP